MLDIKHYKDVNHHDTNVFLLFTLLKGALMSIEDLNQSKEELFAINPKDVKKPTMPIEDVVGESQALYYWSKDDEPKLLSIGIKTEAIESLPVLSRALKAAESLWIAKKNELEDIHTQWNTESEEAEDFRSQMLHTFRYAFRKNEQVLSKIRLIGKGYTNNDLVQDLNDLSEIGKAHPEELNAINYDLTILDTASEMSDRIGDTLAKSKADDFYHESLDLRNRAYTKLWEVVKEIRAAGTYLFWRDDDRFDGYVSEYNRKRRAHKNNNEPETQEENITI